MIGAAHLTSLRVRCDCRIFDCFGGKHVYKDGLDILRVPNTTTTCKGLSLLAPKHPLYYPRTLSMSPSVVYADAVLFDMDGTLTDSIGTQRSSRYA